MKLSRRWTTDERLHLIAACAKVVIRSIENGARYGEPGLPNMEAIRIITLCPARELNEKKTRSLIDMIVQAADLDSSIHHADGEERLDDIRACATIARDHAMAGGEYGALGVPTMETIYMIAVGPSSSRMQEEIRGRTKQARADLRSGEEAFNDTVEGKQT